MTLFFQKQGYLCLLNHATSIDIWKLSHVNHELFMYICHGRS